MSDEFDDLSDLDDDADLSDLDDNTEHDLSGTGVCAACGVVHDIDADFDTELPPALKRRINAYLNTLPPSMRAHVRMEIQKLSPDKIIAEFVEAFDHHFSLVAPTDTALMAVLDVVGEIVGEERLERHMAFRSAEYNVARQHLLVKMIEGLSTESFWRDYPKFAQAVDGASATARAALAAATDTYRSFSGDFRIDETVIVTGRPPSRYGIYAPFADLIDYVDRKLLSATDTNDTDADTTAPTASVDRPDA